MKEEATNDQPTSVAEDACQVGALHECRDGLRCCGAVLPYYAHAALYHCRHCGSFYTEQDARWVAAEGLVCQAALEAEAS